MPTLYTLFGMNVVGDSPKPITNQPPNIKDYFDVLKSQVYTSKPLKEKVNQVRVQCQVRARIPTTQGGEMYLYLYKNDQDAKEHLAIVYGDDIRSKSLDETWQDETVMNRIIRGSYYGKLDEMISDSPHLTPEQLTQLEVKQSELKAKWKPSQVPPLVRIHSECFTGETVHSARCDCGEQLDSAMAQMQAAGRGVVVYLRQEGRNIGLMEKLKAYNLQDLGHDTVAANVLLQHPEDGRTYDIANEIIKDLQLESVHLLTNNPDKIKQLESFGDVNVVKRQEMVPQSWAANSPLRNEMDKYLAVKVQKMGHILDLPKDLIRAL